MKVFVIGPTSPYRGGIVHSNMMFCESLSKNNDLTSISFSRLFPKSLYPGQFQKSNKKEKTSFKSIELLDSINPLNWEKVVQLIKKEKPDQVIFQWWSTFFTPCYTYIASRIKNSTNVSVICQNVLPHEANKIHEILTKIFFSQVNNFTCLSKSDLNLLKRISPNAKANYLIEPTTESNFPKTNITKQAAQKKLGLKGKNILFFGFIRPYKGLNYLLKALPQILNEFPDLKLLIVGEFWKDKKKYFDLIDELNVSKNIVIVDKYVPDNMVPVYFKAVDAVVLPYVSSTESGIIQLAFGLGLPVITSAAGGNPDLIDQGKTGLIFPVKNSNAISKAVKEFYTKNMANKISKNMLRSKGKFLWSKEKEKILFGQY